MTLEFCSSREALYTTLEKNENQESSHLIDRLKQLPHHAKAIKLVELIQSINNKCIVFTEYRSTQIYLQWFLKEHGISSVPFRGGFNLSKKDWIKLLFIDHAQDLFAAEENGESIILQ